MLAHNAPLWSGCPSFSRVLFSIPMRTRVLFHCLLGIVFDTHGIRASNLPEKFRAPLSAGYCFQDLCWRWEPPIFAGYHFRYLWLHGDIYKAPSSLTGIVFDTLVSMWHSFVEWLSLFLAGIVFNTCGYVMVFTFGVPTLWVDIIFDTYVGA